MTDDRAEMLRRVIGYTAAVLLLAVALGVFYVLWMGRIDPVLVCFIATNFAAIVGLPAVCMAALIVVVLFRQSESPIEFEGLGFKFKGPSGEIVLWVLCFVAMAGAVHLLWVNDPSICEKFRSITEWRRGLSH